MSQDSVDSYEKGHYAECMRHAQDILAPLKYHLQTGTWLAREGVTSQLLAIERANEAPGHATTKQNLQIALREIERLRSLNLEQERHIEALKLHNLELEQKLHGKDYRLRDKDNRLNVARKALDESLSLFYTVRRVLDLRFLDMRCLAERLELALQKPTFQTVFKAVKDEVLLLWKTSSLSSPGKPLYPYDQQRLSPAVDLPRPRDDVEKELKKKEMAFNLRLTKLEAAAKDQLAAPALGFSLPRPPDRVRLPEEWMGFQPSSGQDLCAELIHRYNAIVRARDEVARTAPAASSAAAYDGLQVLAEAAMIHASAPAPKPALRPLKPKEVIDLTNSSPPQQETALPPAPAHTPAGYPVDVAVAEPSLGRHTTSSSTQPQTAPFPSPRLLHTDQHNSAHRQQQVASEAEPQAATQAEGQYRDSDMPDERMEDEERRGDKSVIVVEVEDDDLEEGEIRD